MYVKYPRVDDADPVEEKVRVLADVVRQHLTNGLSFGAAWNKAVGGYNNRFRNLRTEVAVHLANRSASHRRAQSTEKQLELL